MFFTVLARCMLRAVSLPKTSIRWVEKEPLNLLIRLLKFTVESELSFNIISDLDTTGLSQHIYCDSPVRLKRGFQNKIVTGLCMLLKKNNSYDKLSV